MNKVLAILIGAILIQTSAMANANQPSGTTRVKIGCIFVSAPKSDEDQSEADGEEDVQEFSFDLSFIGNADRPTEKPSKLLKMPTASGRFELKTAAVDESSAYAVILADKNGSRSASQIVNAWDSLRALKAYYSLGSVKGKDGSFDFNGASFLQLNVGSDKIDYGSYGRLAPDAQLVCGVAAIEQKSL